jgi:flagellin
MLARSEGLKVSLDNISDAKNMLSVAEGGMSKITDIMVQMRNKAEQAASDTLGSSERSAIQTQLSAYAAQVQDIVDQTKWNGVKLLDQTTGTKTFQTGADEGDKVQWALADKLDPTSLGISENNTTATATTTVAGAGSVTGQASIAALGTLSKLDTGGYSVEILDKTALATTGKVNTGANIYPTNVSGIVGSAATGGTQLASGNYTLQITGTNGLTGAAQRVDYRVLNTDGTVAFSKAAVDMSSGSTELADAVGSVGIGVTTTGDLTSGQQIGFEYIAKGYAKYELNDASGVAQTVSKDGTAGNTAQYGYFNANSGGSATVNTGRGFSFTSGATFASITTSDTHSFDYLAAGSNVVDVSSASKAASYMTTVNNSLDNVTKAMSNLGSLMARLTFKEESVSTAQLNVEAAHSRIMNANMAEEQMNASKYTILQQTAISMLAQANQAPQNLLSLFR